MSIEEELSVSTLDEPPAKWQLALKDCYHFTNNQTISYVYK